MAETKIKKPRTQAKKVPKTGGFAVLATGGKQYLVSEGSRVKIEKLPGDHKEGDSITFDNILLVSNASGEVSLGNPFVKAASITATLSKIGRHKTVDVIKYKQKSRYFKKYGHRQPYFEITIDSVKHS